MKAAQPHQSEQPSRRAAAEPARVALAPVEVSFIDNRPEAIAQRRLADVIHHSPYMVAQRQQLHGLFGKAAQLQAGPEEDELLQGKFAAIQRLAGQEEEELLQGKFDPVQRAEAEQKREPRVNNTGLPDNLKTGIESLSGLSMDHVRVHYNSSQPAQLNALAYAQGSNIHVAPGQEQHLPHEAWHVVQQAQGRVQPTMQMKDGVPVNDDAGLEHEADVMGAKAIQMIQENFPVNAIHGAYTVLQRVLAKCDDCGKFFDDEKHGNECPHCESKNYNYPDEEAKSCPEQTCPNHRIEVDTGSPHCPACKKLDKTTKLVHFRHFEGIDLPEEDERLTKSERKLKALVQQVQSFVAGSGTHHRSTKGSHTAAAGQKHSEAHHSKKLQREKFAQALADLIEVVERDNENSEVLESARNARSAVLNK